jgi:hypothetical protein
LEFFIKRNIEVSTCVAFSGFPIMQDLMIHFSLVWGPVLKVCPFSSPSIHPRTGAFIGLGPVCVTYQESFFVCF